MPYSLVIQSIAMADTTVAQAQGPALQAMLLKQIQQIDPAATARLHDAPGARPFTLSPLSVIDNAREFQVFRLPRQRILPQGTVCSFRLTLLDDQLFPLIRRAFEEPINQTFALGETEFGEIAVHAPPESEHAGVCSRSYPELIDRALQRQRRSKLLFTFLTPTCFRQGNLDLPLPLPRLIFQSYKKRFEQFYQVAFLPEFEELVEQHVGIAAIKHFKTELLQTKHLALAGFTGEVTFIIRPHAPPELLFQANLLAEFAFFCGTGRKTTVGMGQTLLAAPHSSNRQKMPVSQNIM